VVAVVVILAGIALAFLLLRGGDASDEDAIRSWFSTPAGGRAPEEVLASIHLAEPCLFTDVTSGSRPVMRCGLTTDAPTPVLHTCFVMDGGRVLRGGWRLAELDACNGLRYDRATRTLFDLVAKQHYRVTE
jgi:hypothetical protein